MGVSSATVLADAPLRRTRQVHVHVRGQHAETQRSVPIHLAGKGRVLGDCPGPSQSGWNEDDSCTGCRFAPLPAPDGVAAFVTLVPRAEFGTFMRNMPPGEGRAIGVEVVDPPNSDYIYVYEAGDSS